MSTRLNKRFVPLESNRTKIEVHFPPARRPFPHSEEEEFDEEDYDMEEFGDFEWEEDTDHEEDFDSEEEDFDPED